MGKYYHIAIIGHINHHDVNDRTQQCYDTLSQLGHSVELIDTFTYPDILDEEGEPNWEFLTTFMESFSPDYIAYQEESADEILDFLTTKKPGAGRNTPSKHFVVFGYLGKGNFGDELIFSISKSRLEEKFPDCYITVLGHEAYPLMRDYGVCMVHYIDKDSQDRILNGAAGLLYMAGLIVDTHYKSYSPGRTGLFIQPHAEINGQAATTMLAYMHNVPVFYFGIGAGPFENEEAQDVLRLASLTKPIFFCRDENTKELLLESGIESNIVLSSTDAAFLIRKSIPSIVQKNTCKIIEMKNKYIGGKDYIVVSVRYWDTMKNKDGFIASIARLLSYVIEEQKKSVVFIALQKDDVVLCREIVKNISLPNKTWIYGQLEDETTPVFIENVIQLISHADFAIATRLHASIVANMLGVCSIGIDYEDKVGAFYRQMGMDKFLLPIDFNSEAAKETVEELLIHMESNEKTIRQACDENSQIIEKHFEQMNDMIESGNPRYRRPSFIFPEAEIFQHLHDKDNALFDKDMRIQTLEKSVEELTRERSQLETQLNESNEFLNEVYRSRTWRLGEVLLKIPKKIKYFFGKLIHH